MKKNIDDYPDITKYFEKIAEIAKKTVKEKDLPVKNETQKARATTWSAIAIHPMSVLETEYVSIVQKVYRETKNQDEARENAFKELSKFFSLSSGPPPLLRMETEPLIEERMKILSTRFESLKEEYNELESTAVYDELVDLVTEAVALIGLMADKKELAYTTEHLKKAASYLHLFGVNAVTFSAAVGEWKKLHTYQKITEKEITTLLYEIECELIKPLRKSVKAVASPRCLYNIGPFYLFRLMRRFVGGNQLTPMDLKSKRVASGAVTKAMHQANWSWLTEWHLDQIANLNIELKKLNEKFDSNYSDIIRFYLKGGRAMNIALGTPDKGENDWDTGVLINPYLPAKQWYEAFAEVNDLIVAFLDKARFSYTALLTKNLKDLSNFGPDVNSIAQVVDLSDESDYTKMALLAEHHEEEASRMAGCQRVSAHPKTPMNRLTINRWTRPSGVNGELIDIGIPKRSSVELKELWFEIKIQEIKLKEKYNIPVPGLCYFIRDFSTIIREAISDDTADNKLVKRLLRLNRVLNYDKEINLNKDLKKAEKEVTKGLPQYIKSLETSQFLKTSAIKHLHYWVFAELLKSKPSGFAGSTWESALDEYLQGKADDLLKESKKEAKETLKDSAFSPSIEENERKACRELLTVQVLVSKVSRKILQDAGIIAKSLLSETFKLNDPLKKAFELIKKQENVYYFTGVQAGIKQTDHTKLKTDYLQNNCPSGAYEIFCCDQTSSLGNSFESINEKLNEIFKEYKGQIFAKLIGMGSESTLVVSTSKLSKIDLEIIKPENIALLIIRHERDNAEKAIILDYLEGYPVASTRDLTRLFAKRAADSPDYNLRQAFKKSAEFLRLDVLGRQLRTESQA